MIGPLWKKVEQLERRQTSLLSTIALCSFCSAVMLTAGIYKGEARAEAAQAGEAKRITALKPVPESVDTGSRLFVDKRPGAARPDWELNYASQEAITLRKMLLETLQKRNASPAEFEAADVEFVAALKQVQELPRVLETKIRLEQEASSEESKDAISKDVGDSG